MWDFVYLRTVDGHLILIVNLRACMHFSYQLPRQEQNSFVDWLGMVRTEKDQLSVLYVYHAQSKQRLSKISFVMYGYSRSYNTY